jgi:AmmeMemoRadiSam system protein B
MSIRRAAVAGSWYSASAARLSAEIQQHLDRVSPDAHDPLPPNADLVAVVSPHAGLMYSGPVAAHGYRLLRDRQYDVIALVGPSHYVAFSGVSIWPSGAFETPLGDLRVDEEVAAALLDSSDVIHDHPAAHQREHSLEMQAPFLAALTPNVPIVPMVMGHQTRDTAFALADSLAKVLKGRRALLVASSDLSHFFDASTAARLDAKVIDSVERLDPETLMMQLEQRPDHACGGGPMVAVLRAAQLLGATSSRVLRYADSGDISGDKSSVVGYVSAAVWR